MKPDLAGRVERDGDELVITVFNEPLPSNGTSGGNARASVATLKLNEQTQTIQVPALGANTSFEKRVPIPSDPNIIVLKVTLKVNTTNTVQGDVLENNTFTTSFKLASGTGGGGNRADLTPVTFEGGNLNTKVVGAHRIAYVKNEGRKPSTLSKARFTYFLANGQKQEILLAIPVVPPGETVELRISPNTCSSFPPSGDCNFMLEVDISDTVNESDEDNNAIRGGDAG